MGLCSRQGRSSRIPTPVPALGSVSFWFWGDDSLSVKVSLRCEQEEDYPALRCSTSVRLLSSILRRNYMSSTPRWRTSTRLSRKAALVMATRRRRSKVRRSGRTSNTSEYIDLIYLSSRDNRSSSNNNNNRDNNRYSDRPHLSPGQAKYE